MIHVQIASDITTTGVEGVRWVLLEPSEAPAPDAASPAPAAAGPMPQPMVAPLLPARPSLRFGVWPLAIIGLGLVGALGLSQQRMGLASLRGGGPAAAPAPTAHTALPPDSRVPAAPAASAARPEPKIAAGL